MIGSKLVLDRTIINPYNKVSFEIIIIIKRIFYERVK